MSQLAGRRCGDGPSEVKSFRLVRRACSRLYVPRSPSTELNQLSAVQSVRGPHELSIKQRLSKLPSG
jgi:hypothetical protein